MPEIDSIEATRTIREQERNSGRRTPIVALTAGALKPEREKCLASGMDDFLAKPIETGRLIEIIHRYLAAEPTTGS